jgi:hypothetical protein
LFFGLAWQNFAFVFWSARNSLTIENKKGKRPLEEIFKVKRKANNANKHADNPLTFLSTVSTGLFDVWIELGELCVCFLEC